MSGPFPINLARPSVITRPCKLDIKSLSASSLDAPSLDEKQWMHENEQAEGVRANTHQANPPFSRADVTKVLKDLLAFSKAYLALPYVRNNALDLLKTFSLLQSKREPMLLKEAVIQPNLALVTSRPVTVDALTPKPFSAECLRKELDSLIETKSLLKEGLTLLAGEASPVEAQVKELFEQYQGQIKTLEVTIRQGWYQAVRQESQNASSPVISCFTEEQGYVIIDCVDELSALSVDLARSSKPLCKVPKLADSRFLHSLVSASFSVASASIAYVTGAAIAAVGLTGALFLVSGLIAFWAYGKYKNAEVKQWKERINKLTNTTKLEQLKGEVMSGVSRAQRVDIDRIDVSQQGQAKEITELKAQNQQLTEENQQLKSILDDVLNRVKALEPNPNSNPPQANEAVMPVSKDTANPFA